MPKLIRKKQNYFFKVLLGLTMALSVYQPFFIIALPALFLMAIDKTESLKATAPFLLLMFFFPIAFHFRFLQLESIAGSEYATVKLFNKVIESKVFIYTVMFLVFLSLFYFYAVSLDYNEKGNPDNYYYNNLPVNGKMLLKILSIFSILFSFSFLSSIISNINQGIIGRLLYLIWRMDNINEERSAALVLGVSLAFIFLCLRFILLLQIEKKRKVSVY